LNEELRNSGEIACADVRSFDRLRRSAFEMRLNHT
jgi:hypothetical protein